MKLLKDYSEDELTKLSPEEKHSLFLIECADRGIALPSSMPEYLSSPEDRDDLKPDLTIYQLGGVYSSNNYYFKTLDEAQAVASLVSSTSIKLAQEYRSGSDNILHITNGGTQDIEVSPKQVYSAGKYAELKGEIDRFNAQKTTVDKNNQRRTEILDKHAELMSEIDDAIYEAEKNITRIKEFADIFNQYLTMANNDHDIAVRFLLNAHHNEVADYDEDKLEKIGISKQDIADYDANSKTDTDD